jgi:hypothetical protein
MSRFGMRRFRANPVTGFTGEAPILASRDRGLGFTLTPPVTEGPLDETNNSVSKESLSSEFAITGPQDQVVCDCRFPVSSALKKTNGTNYELRCEAGMFEPGIS